ncbi:unnamed protein product [Schistosoma turkestanicum]|nr:unnamed protein product [Schistosoma turkestanicum]
MPIMSLRHVSPRAKHHHQQQQPNSISSERDYNYHIKHSYDKQNTTNYYLIDKPYKNYKSKYNNVFLSQSKLYDTSNVLIDRKNPVILKQYPSKIDKLLSHNTTTNNNSNSSHVSLDNYSTYSIPSKLRSMYNYGANISTVSTNSNHLTKELFDNSNIKNRHSKSIHCQSPIIHARNSIHNITNNSNNNNQTRLLNDGFNLFKQTQNAKKYSKNFRQCSINNSYDDVINLNKLTDSNQYLSSVS